MRAVYVLFALFVSAYAHVHGDHGHKDDQPTATTPSGVIQGRYMTSRRGRQFEAYRGIRYAEPPVGELRFQPPKLITQYSAAVNASGDGPACPQPGDTFMDEDCLRLNVYTPNKNSKTPLPVLVFIHAGGFYSVSGRSDIAGPGHLLDRDLVLVTINYRLGSLGFLSTGDSVVPGNNGFKDQVAALRWVQRNIAAFGGDPARVTAAGYSAGAISAALHMVSPMSRGLIHRVISMSGSPFSQVKVPHHQRHLAEKQARLLGCPTTTTKAIVDCLKTKTWKELGDSLDGFSEFAYDPILIWEPIVEPDFGQERFLPQHPLELLSKTPAIPLMVSQTRDEFFWEAFTVLENETFTSQMNKEWEKVAPIPFLLPSPADNAARVLRAEYLGDRFPLRNDSRTADRLGKLYGDGVIGFGVHRLANLAGSNFPGQVFYYMFDYIGRNSHYQDPVTDKPVGVAHHDDLIYLFNIEALFPPIALAGDDSDMVDKMTAIVYNFMRHGDPNNHGDTPELSQMKWASVSSQRNYLQIGKQFSVHQKLFEDRFKVWEKLYPIEEVYGLKYPNFEA